jgi:hypothetical protein
LTAGLTAGFVVAVRLRGACAVTRYRPSSPPRAPYSPSSPHPPPPHPIPLQPAVELQSDLQRCQAQLEAESAKRERGVAQLVLLKAIYTIVCALEELGAPDCGADCEADNLRKIEEAVEAVRAAVLAPGRATALAGAVARSRSEGAPEWSGIDAPFLPSRPFLQRWVYGGGRLRRAAACTSAGQSDPA